MAQRHLHHLNITLFCEVVCIYLAWGSLGLIRVAFFSTLRICEVVGVVFGGHSLGSFEIIKGLRHSAALAAC